MYNLISISLKNIYKKVPFDTTYQIKSTILNSTIQYYAIFFLSDCDSWPWFLSKYIHIHRHVSRNALSSSNYMYKYNY